MLMRGRMEDQFGVEIREYHVNAFLVAHCADEDAKVKLRIIPQELKLNGVCVILIHIKYYQCPGFVFRNLSAKLASYRTSAAGDQHYTILNIVLNTGHIDIYGVPAQQVLYLNIADLTDTHLSIGKLKYPGKGLHLASGLLAYLDDLPVCRVGGRGHYYDYFLYAICLSGADDLFPSPDYADASHIAPVLFLVIVNNTDHFVFGAFAALKIPESDRSGPACSD